MYLKKVVDCITNGQCEHVTNAPLHYVQEARVHVLHIVHAVPGFSKEIDTHIENFFAGSQARVSSPRCNLHTLTPYEMAILKDYLRAIESKRITYNPFAMLYISGKENEKVHFRRVSFDVLCVEKNNLQLLANILDNRRHALVSIDVVFEAALKHNKTQIIELIVDNREWLMKDPTSENCRNDCCKLAIK